MRFGCVRFIFMRITLRSVESDLSETLEGQHGMCVVLIQSMITEWGRFDIYILHISIDSQINYRNHFRNAKVNRNGESMSNR